MPDNFQFSNYVFRTSKQHLTLVNDTATQILEFVFTVLHSRVCSINVNF